jgi:hypothetical protein
MQTNPVLPPERTTPEIRRLPAVYRWEFLRRHPDYHKCWQWANKYRRDYLKLPPNDPQRQELEWRKCEIAAGILSRLTGYAWILEYPDPSLSAQELSSRGWLSLDGRDNVHAPTFATLVEAMLIGLPPNVRGIIGSILGGSIKAEDAAEEMLARIESLYQVAARTPELQARPDGLLSYNLHAPLRAIREEAACLIREQQERHGVKEARRRHEMLPVILKVWDMREGWQNGHYEKSASQTLKQIQSEIGIPFQTALDRYKSAYQLIIAEDYEPLHWSYWFRRELLRSPSRLMTWRRPKSLRQSVPEVTEAQLGASVEYLSDCKAASESAPSCDESTQRLFLDDLRALFDKGKSNQDIIIELELPQHLNLGKELDELRDRHSDGLL